MKIQAITLLTPFASKSALAFACALLLGVGWATKLGVEQLGSINEKISDGFTHSSVLHKTNSAALPPPPSSIGTLSLPTNPAAPVLQ